MVITADTATEGDSAGELSLKRVYYPGKYLSNYDLSQSTATVRLDFGRPDNYVASGPYHIAIGSDVNCLTTIGTKARPGQLEFLGRRRVLSADFRCGRHTEGLRRFPDIIRESGQAS